RHYSAIACTTLYSFPTCDHPPTLHSFPTRRSSDLRRAAAWSVAQLRRTARRIHRAQARAGAKAAGTSGRHRARRAWPARIRARRSEEHTSELQSLAYLVCRLLLEKKKKITIDAFAY